MLARASRVLPGMLVTMLLAAFAVTAHAAAPDDSSHSVRAGHTQDQKRPQATASRVKPSAKPERTASATTRRRQPAATPKPDATTGTVQSAAFIDDNFSYADTATGAPAWQQSGTASWYGGSRWQGRMTSSGVRYDQNALTAAHATLPLGSKIKVKLQHSDRVVVVTITDRPGTRTRIIDLSMAAAKALGILSQGVAMVTLLPNN